MSAMKFLSESDLNTLAGRISEVFAERVKYGQFTLTVANWALDQATNKYTQSIFVGSDFNDNYIGSVGVDMSAINTVSQRITVMEELSDCNISALDISNGSLVFYADDIPAVNIPIMIYIVGSIPEEVNP